jgi:hypothetical protein
MEHGLQKKAKRHDAGFPLRALERTIKGTIDISTHFS